MALDFHFHRSSAGLSVRKAEASSFLTSPVCCCLPSSVDHYMFPPIISCQMIHDSSRRAAFVSFNYIRNNIKFPFLFPPPICYNAVEFELDFVFYGPSGTDAYLNIQVK